jgi:hypothetical protein
MSEWARKFLTDFFHEAEFHAQNDPSYAPCYRRWAEQACRIAVCLQVGFFGSQAHCRELDPYCAQKAVELMKWFGAQQKELIADIVQTTEERYKARVTELAQAAPDGIKLRDAYKKIGTSRKVLEKIIRDDPQLEIVKIDTGGRPSERIILNPATMGL